MKKGNKKNPHMSKLLATFFFLILTPYISHLFKPPNWMNC